MDRVLCVWYCTTVTGSVSHGRMFVKGGMSCGTHLTKALSFRVRRGTSLRRWPSQHSQLLKRGCFAAERRNQERRKDFGNSSLIYASYQTPAMSQSEYGRCWVQPSKGFWSSVFSRAVLKLNCQLAVLNYRRCLFPCVEQTWKILQLSLLTLHIFEFLLP